MLSTSLFFRHPSTYPMNFLAAPLIKKYKLVKKRKENMKEGRKEREREERGKEREKKRRNRKKGRKKGNGID